MLLNEEDRVDKLNREIYTLQETKRKKKEEKRKLKLYIRIQYLKVCNGLWGWLESDRFGDAILKPIGEAANPLFDVIF